MKTAKQEHYNFKIFFSKFFERRSYDDVQDHKTSMGRLNENSTSKRIAIGYALYSAQTGVSLNRNYYI